MNVDLSHSPHEKRLRAICTGKGFAIDEALPGASEFPAALLAQTDAFEFKCVPTFSEAQSRLSGDLQVDLLLIDTDGPPLDVVRRLVREARRRRPSLPIVAFSHRADDRMRYLMLDGVTWHFTKRSRRWQQLAEALSPLLPSLTGLESPSGEASADHLIHNPYVVGRPLARAAESLFFGRSQVFAWVAENLLGAARPNVLLLMGRRRIGKTSALYQLVEGGRGRPLRENLNRPVFPIYVDLQRYAGRSTDEWLRFIASDLYRKASGWPSVTLLPFDELSEGAPYEALDRCLDTLEESLPPGGLALLAVDEVEQVRDGLDSGKLEPQLLAYLRSQLQHRSHIAFLLCGSRNLRESFWHPIFKLAVSCELGPLSHEETARLIRQPVSGAMAFEETAVDAIWRRTTGHPYLVQAVCHRLVTLANREVHRRPVSEVNVARAIEQLIADGLTEGLELTELEAATWRNASPPQEVASW